MSIESFTKDFRNENFPVIFYSFIQRPGSIPRNISREIEVFSISIIDPRRFSGLNFTMIALLFELVIVVSLPLCSKGEEEISPMQPLTEQEKSCFRSDLQLRSRDPDGYITWFNVFGRGECWRYCQVTLTCQALTFDIINSTCYLYHESHYSVPIEGIPDSNGNVTLEKLCTKIKRGIDVEMAIDMSEDKGGVLIMKADENENKCMMKRNRQSYDKKEYKSVSVKFGRCYGGGRNWVFRKVGVEASSNRHLLTISPADNPDLCLDVKLGEQEPPMAVLRYCREISPGNLTDKQIMIVKDFWHADRINSYYIFSRWSDTSLLGTGKEYEYLDGLLFQDPENFTNIGSCHLSQLKIPNGMLKNSNKLPFFLAGHSVTIACKKGYGVKKLNYNRTQTLVCSEDAKPYLCTKSVNSRKDKSDGLMKKGGLLAVICLVAVSVLVSFPLVTWSLYKTKRSDPDTPDVVDGDEAAHTGSKEKREEEDVGEN